MSPSSLLPRLLLIALLILASAGSAFSGVQMALEDAAARATVMDTQAAPCHAEASLRGDVVPELPAPPTAPDCCKMGHCDGVCLQALPALPAVIATASVPLAGLPLMRGDYHGHPAPLLDRPQRPPIG